MILNITVKPNSGKQKIIEDNERGLIVFLKSAPENNKANIELVRFLKKHYKKNVKIKSGLTSKKKVIELI